MKTHDVSRNIRMLLSEKTSSNITELRFSDEILSALNTLADKLSEGPNLLVDEVRITKRTDEVASGLRNLVLLSGYSKQQWLSIVNDYNIAIELNPRDSARDVLGKVLRYLDAHPELVKSIGSKSKKSKIDTSALENTLAKLLERKDD